MRNIEQRAELDDFELAENYDFSDGIRGRFYQSKKITATVQLDNDVLLFLTLERGSEKPRLILPHPASETPTR